jgi:transcription antitermination protein NusB
MLSRRHLRIRVMQSLYTWYQSEEKNTNKAIENLFLGSTRTYDLYLSLLQLLPELCDEEDRYYIDLPPRHIAKEQSVFSKLSSNAFVDFLRTDIVFTKGLANRKISWQKESDLIKKVFFQLRQSEEYKKYVAQSTHSVQEDVEMCSWIYKNIIVSSEALMNTLEEQNMWWAEALELINSMVLKTIRIAHPNRKGQFELMPLFRDEEDDKAFMDRLFRETVNNDAYFEKLIADKTKNWEVDRIALMDVILLKMALSEILHFPGIPVKVSINEYIDISKDYSTPKSKVFINGVIDKLVADLKTDGTIKKTGRGLIE